MLSETFFTSQHGELKKNPIYETFVPGICHKKWLTADHQSGMIWHEACRVNKGGD